MRLELACSREEETSPPASIAEVVIHQLRRRGVEARRLFQIGKAGAGDGLGRAEGEQERPLARRPDAGDFVERASHELLLAPGAVGSDGEAMGFVAQALDEEQRRIARRQPKRFPPLDEERLAPGVAVRGPWRSRGRLSAPRVESLPLA